MIGKTESILFGSKRKLHKVSTLNITCNGIKIKATSSVKYLGATMDQYVNGELMANNILHKAHTRLKYLYRQAPYLCQNTKKTLCSSLILCHFDYSCSSWYSGLTKFTKTKLQTCQNKIARYVLNYGPRCHIGPEELSKIGWLNVEQRVNQLKLSHVFKIHKNKCPNYLKEQFTEISTLYNYNTRSSNYNFYVPSVNGIADRTFYYTGIKCWNSLPDDIKAINDQAVFKKSVKSFFNEHTL